MAPSSVVDIGLPVSRGASYAMLGRRGDEFCDRFGRRRRCALSSPTRSSRRPGSTPMSAGAKSRRRLYLVLFICMALIATPLAWVYARNGLYGINVVLRRGGSVWPSVARDDPRLTPAVQLALKGAVGTPGPLTWTPQRPGFEVGELPILVDGKRSTACCWRASIRRSGGFRCMRRRRGITISTFGCANSARRWSSTAAISA